MTPLELLALSLGLSFGVAALGLAAGATLERHVRDPGVRERAWTAALYGSASPPLIIGVLLLAPPPTATGALPGTASSIIVEAAPLFQVMADRPGLGVEAAAIAILGFAGLLAAVRAARLTMRSLRLRRLVRAARPAPTDVVEIVRKAARRVGVVAPPVRVSTAAGVEAMITGLRRPVLVVSDGLAVALGDPTAFAVCAHELAHLKRGDHRALWAEEILLTLLAANPLLAALRQRRAAAREESCDMLALAHAPVATRRLYAQALVDALKTTASPAAVPALTFTSAKRTLAMLRLKAILDPASPAGPRSRCAAVGLGVAVVAAALTGSVAVAGQREAVPAPPLAERPNSGAEAASVTPPTAQPVPAGGLNGPAIAALAESRPTAARLTGPVRDNTTPPASPGQSAPQARVITNPSWAQHPMPIYPAEAFDRGVSQASVVLSCGAHGDGSLSDCSVVTEDPVDHGFGAAAINAAQTARLAPATVSDAAPETRVRFTIRFRLADPA